MGKTKIIATEGGFAIVEGKNTDEVALGAIVCVQFYKLDEFTTDLICCEITTSSKQGRQVRIVHEEVAGFGAMVSRLETLHGFRRDWRAHVVPTPFASNALVAYRLEDAGTANLE